MEFGKLEDIASVDRKMPDDDPRNAARISSPSTLKIHFGSPAWGQKLWIDKIYPKGTPAEKFLYHYSRHFNCIELNTTHYRIPDDKITHEWMEEVPENFRFCPKVNKDISHSRMGLLDKDLHRRWFHFLEQLGEKQGPGFIQFHEKFSYLEKAMLFRFIESWPQDFKLSIELRHASWYERNSVIPALVDYLHKKGIGLVITDVAGRRDILHSNFSTDWSMIRLIGNDLHESDQKRLNDWASRFLEWEKLGLKDVYFLLHQPDDVLTIEFAQMASKILSTKGFLNLPDFSFVKQPDLFNTKWD